jgi:hypothetical protein
MLVGLRNHFTRASAAAYSSQMRAVPSVEALSLMIRVKSR